MTATVAEARPMGLVPVPDGSGGVRHEWRALPPEKPKGRKKARPAPDPIHANPEAAAQTLKLLIERRERLEEEKAGIADDIKEVNAEAKTLGFDVKAISTIIAMRKLDKHVRLENESILETYKCALGIE
jgi:uncharacterized protein (UPF0335 family)